MAVCFMDHALLRLKHTRFFEYAASGIGWSKRIWPISIRSIRTRALINIFL